MKRGAKELTAVPRKIRASWWAMALRREDTGVTKYEVRSEEVRRNEVAQGEEAKRRVRNQIHAPVMLKAPSRAHRACDG